MDNKKSNNDPFTLHVLGNIDPNVFKTLNILQIEAIKNAVSASIPKQKHPIDIRIMVPLFFLKLYLVLLIGRDRRSETRNKEDARKQKAGKVSMFAGAYLFISACFPILFLLLYIFKSLLGIDLMPDQHLWDLF